ncbi:MAG: hypothetical protein Q8M16_04740 [Pirellulaceae bacterium]|nr:hypothetical protein [Pirellulaceae bacterium]
MSGPVNPYQPPFRPQAAVVAPGIPTGVPMTTGPQKPVSIIIFGIFHLFVALFSFLWLTWLTVMLVIAMNTAGANGPMAGQPGMNRPNRANDPLLLIYDQTGYVQYQIFVIVLGAVLTLVLIAAGILLLLGKDKGRDLSVSYSFASIILNILSMAFQFFTGFMLLNSTDYPRSMTQPAGTMVMVGGGLLFFCLIYPTLTLIFMTRKSVKEYLQRK